MASGAWVDTVEALADMPSLLQAELARVESPAVAQRPGPQEWSVAEILAHMRASDFIQTSRIWAVLVRPDGVHPGLDERAYGDLIQRSGLSVPAQLEAFSLRRDELVRLLRSLTRPEWQTAIRMDFGVKTIAVVVAEVAEHEHLHLEQIRGVTVGRRRS